jgi:hypothetical protein
MRPLRYSINVTLDGCCDHRAIPADEELHRHAVENLDQADALLLGRVTYQMMEAAFRPPAQTGARPDLMEPFARTIDAKKKYVVSSTYEAHGPTCWWRDSAGGGTLVRSSWHWTQRVQDQALFRLDPCEIDKTICCLPEKQGLRGFPGAPKNLSGAPRPRRREASTAPSD